MIGKINKSEYGTNNPNDGNGAFSLFKPTEEENIYLGFVWHFLDFGFLSQLIWNSLFLVQSGAQSAFPGPQIHSVLSLPAWGDESS